MGTEVTKKTIASMDRITLQGEARDRLRKWVNELNDQIKGLRLTKTDLVNHLILDQAEKFSAEDITGIRKRYFDEVQFATWLLKEVRDAKKRGEPASVATLLSQIKPKRALSRKQKQPQIEAASEVKGGVV